MASVLSLRVASHPAISRMLILHLMSLKYLQCPAPPESSGRQPGLERQKHPRGSPAPSSPAQHTTASQALPVHKLNPTFPMTPSLYSTLIFGTSPAFCFFLFFSPRIPVYLACSPLEQTAASAPQVLTRKQRHNKEQQAKYSGGKKERRRSRGRIFEEKKSLSFARSRYARRGGRPT